MSSERHGSYGFLHPFRDRNPDWQRLASRIALPRRSWKVRRVSNALNRTDSTCYGSAILDQAVSSPREVDLALRRSGFSSDKALSVLFGDCMKGNWKTHLLVMLRRPVLYQQQAIQTLLYACKVKDMSTRVYPVVEHRLLKTKCQDPTAEMLLQCLDYPRKEDSMIEMLSRVFGTDTVRSDEIELSLCEFRDRQAMKIDQLERDLRAAEFHRKRIEQTTRDDMRNGSNTASELGALKKSIQELVSQVPLHFRPKDSINSFDILSHAITLGTEESIKKEKCMSKIASLKQELVIVHESLQEEMDRIKLQQLQVKRPPPAFDQHMNEFSKRLDQAMEEAREIVELRDDEIKRLNESKRELSATIESQHESLSEMVGYLRHLTPEQDVDTLPNGFTDLLFTLKQSYEDLVSQMEKYRQTNQENSDYITELESDRSKEELNDENKRIRQEVVEYREKMTKMEELEKDLTRTIQSQEDSLREMLNVLGIESQVEFSPLLFVLRDSYQALQHQVWVVKGALEASQHQTFELESQLQELESKYQLICSKMEEKEMQIVTRAMRHVKRKYKDQLNEKEVKIGELQGELEKIRVKYNEMEDSISRANENETKALHRVEELQNEMNQMEKFQDRHTKQVSNSKSECFELLMSNQVTEGHNRRLQVQLMEANVLIQQKEAELHKKQLEIEHYRDNNHEY